MTIYPSLNKSLKKNLHKIVDSTRQAQYRHFEDQALSGLIPVPRFHEDKFNEDKSPIQTRPRENGDKTVTNPSLKAGVSEYTSYRGFSPDVIATCLRADSLRQA